MPGVVGMCSFLNPGDHHDDFRECRARADRRPALPDVRGAPAAIEFYQRVFGAELCLRLDAPDGLMHAELTVGGARFMMTEEREQRRGGRRHRRHAGGGPVLGRPHGLDHRSLGHKWMVATHIEDVSEAQLRERLAKMFAEGQQH
ncbi:hypothetical protein Ddc_20249 [Ditylenchus destructor]|nr:hypothetical protein Ddc_20249 [Ditylenchus destructor]